MYPVPPVRSRRSVAMIYFTMSLFCAQRLEINEKRVLIIEMMLQCLNETEEEKAALKN